MLRYIPSVTPNGVLNMTLRKTFFATAIGAVMLALSALNASAAVVCSGKVCWHAREAFEYPAAAGVVVHPDELAVGPARTLCLARA